MFLSNAQVKLSGEGHFTLSKKRTRFFHNKRILTDFWWILLENKRIFAQGVRDSLGVKCPSLSGAHIRLSGAHIRLAVTLFSPMARK